MKISTRLIICMNASILGLMISSPIQAESLFESFGLGLPAINVSDSADGEPGNYCGPFSLQGVLHRAADRAVLELH